MKRVFDFLYLLSLSILLAACHSGEEWDTTCCGFLISLNDEAVAVTSRATPAEIGKPIAENFNLTITSHKTGATIYDAAYTSGIIPASAGFYSLTATYGENPVLAWDSPYYKGSAEAEVTAGKATSVVLPCSVANSLLSVKFTNPEKFEKFYSLYYVKVRVENSSLDIKNEDTGKSAYFRAGSVVKLEFHAQLKDSGKEVSVEIEDTKLPGTFEAGMHTMLSVGAAIPASGAIFTIDKVEIEKVNISETIPVEWLPKPKVTGFGGSNSLTYTETADALSDAVIRYTTCSPVQDVEFTLDFKDAQYAEYNKTYTLSGMTEEERTHLNSIGITLPVIDGVSQEGQIDLNALTANLITDAGKEVINTIKVNVKANNRWSSETGEDYQIKVVKPEFSVSVQDGNCWTKEFTIDEITVTTGNAEKIRENIVYMYSADGGVTWHDSKDNTIKFDDAPANKNYKVKACFRNYIDSNNTVDVVLETPIQLPNSNMEDWYIETKKKSGTWPFKDKEYYTFHPYAAGAAGTSWWDTNNDLAQGGTYALGIWYEGCFASCVSYTEDAHGGSKAALMYLSGCGSGYANTSGTYVGGAMVGSLFIGSYNSGIVQGHAFASRPTSLSFWYKYKPYKSDAFKVVVSLKSGDEEIASGTYEPVAYSEEDNSYKQAVVNFTYSVTDKKATTICVQFLASNKTSLDGNDFEKGTTINYPTIGNWTVHMGSVLKIDDLSLNYIR